MVEKSLREPQFILRVAGIKARQVMVYWNYLPCQEPQKITGLTMCFKVVLDGMDYK